MEMEKFHSSIIIRQKQRLFEFGTMEKVAMARGQYQICINVAFVDRFAILAERKPISSVYQFCLITQYYSDRNIIDIISK